MGDGVQFTDLLLQASSPSDLLVLPWNPRRFILNTSSSDSHIGDSDLQSKFLAGDPICFNLTREEEAWTPLRRRISRRSAESPPCRSSIRSFQRTGYLSQSSDARRNGRFPERSSSVCFHLLDAFDDESQGIVMINVEIDSYEWFKLLIQWSNEFVMMMMMMFVFNVGVAFCGLVIDMIDDVRSWWVSHCNESSFGIGFQRVTELRSNSLFTMYAEMVKKVYIYISPKQLQLC